MQSDDKSIIPNHFNKLSILEEKFVIKSFLANARYINMSNIKKLKDITKDRERVWLILSHSGKQSYIINEEMEKEDFIDIKLFMYEKKQNISIKTMVDDA
jgi:hypothetical protein